MPQSHNPSASPSHGTELTALSQEKRHEIALSSTQPSIPVMAMAQHHNRCEVMPPQVVAPEVVAPPFELLLSPQALPSPTLTMTLPPALGTVFFPPPAAPHFTQPSESSASSESHDRPLSPAVEFVGGEYTDSTDLNSMLERAKTAMKSRGARYVPPSASASFFPSSAAPPNKKPRAGRRMKLCEAKEGCTKQCSFNYEWETKAIFCSSHKLVDMVDVKHKTCEVEGCTKQPYFNYESVTKGRFCATHKLAHMVNVKHKSCFAVGCEKQPSFNYPGLYNGLYCSLHKHPNMVNVKNKICAEESCIKVPSYNHPGECKPLFCSAHKEPGMVDVISKRCEATGCMKRPSFNYEGLAGCRFCATHKLPGMRDIISRICEMSGCQKNASCNYEGLSRRRFCSLHRLPNMVNIITTKEQQARAMAAVAASEPTWSGSSGSGSSSHSGNVSNRSISSGQKRVLPPYANPNY